MMLIVLIIYSSDLFIFLAFNYIFITDILHKNTTSNISYFYRSSMSNKNIVSHKCSIPYVYSLV